MNVEVKTLPSYYVAFAHHVGAYTECNKAWNSLFAWAAPQGFLTKDAQAIGVSYDDPSKTADADCRYDACLVVPEGTEGNKDIRMQTIQGGLHACYSRKIKLTDIHKGFIELYIWLSQNGYECVGTPFEYYPDMLDSDGEDNPDYEWNIIFCALVRKI